MMHMILFSATSDEIHAADGELQQRRHEDDADLIAELREDARGEMQHFVDLVGVADLVVDRLALALRERSRDFMRWSMKKR